MAKASLRKRLLKKSDVKIGTGKANEINIFAMGTLLQFETHCWQATKKLPKEKMKTLGNSGWVRANKSLINRKKLKDLHAYLTDARKFISINALPFPIKGVYFVPSEKVSAVNEKLENIKVEFNKTADDFSKKYSEFIEEAEVSLKDDDLFNPSDYPRNIREKFSMYWRFFELTIPSNITKELREEETKRFQDLMNETRKMGIIALREGFAEIVTHLTDNLSGRIDGEEKRIHQSSIDKISEFFSEFQGKNIFKDEELSHFIKQAKDTVSGITTKDLNDDDSLVRLVHSQLGKIKDELDNSTETFRRKLIF